MSGTAIRYALDAQSGQPFPVSLFDPGDGNLINDCPISNGWVVDPGTQAEPGREFVVNCTEAGNVQIQFSGGFELTIPMAVGLTRFPWQVVNVIADGTTAVATYANLV